MAGLNDLSNKQQMIYDYIKGTLQSQFPDLDLSDDGVFMETFGVTHISLLMPIFDKLDRIALAQSIENAQYLTEDEMNRLANEKYYEQRQPGSYSKGYVNLVFSDLPSTRQIQIPSGTVAVSKQGYLYSSTDTVIIPEERLGDYYDPSLFQYSIPVLFQAQNVGAVYNVSPGDVNQLQKPMMYLEGVQNEEYFKGGTDKETNVQLAQRIKDGAISRTPGVLRGYKRYIKDNFTTVEDVLVVGFGHPLMRRDIIGQAIQDIFVQTARDVQWGGKTDLYIRGTDLQSFTETLAIQSVPSFSTTTSDPTLSQNAQIGVLLSRTPMWDIQSISLVNNDPSIDPNTLLITNYMLKKDETFDTVRTLNEKAWVIIEDGRVTTGTAITVTYRFNNLITQIDQSVNYSQNRPPCADILIKEAHRKFVFGGIVVKPKVSLGLQDSDKSTLRQDAYTYIGGISLGDSLQTNELYNAVTDSSDAQQIIDYMRLPGQLITTDNLNKYLYYCLDQVSQSYIGRFNADNPFLDALFNVYNTQLSVYDFFDTLHILTYDNGFDDAMNQLEFDQDPQWIAWSRQYRLAKQLAVRANVNSMLFQPTYPVEEYEYFDMGDIIIYEEQDYALNDWKNLITLGNTLASHTWSGDSNPMNILHLTCYCLGMIYVVANKTKLTNDNSSLNAFFQTITRGTEIQDYF